MSALRRHPDALGLVLTGPERMLLSVLLERYQELLPGDDVPDRLLPDGYRGDPEAAAEFRQYTRGGLIAGKLAGAERIRRAIADSADAPAAEIVLAEDDAERWLPVLTDLRLLLAERLGIRHDDDEPGPGELTDVYHWLGGLQGMLIAGLDE